MSLFKSILCFEEIEKDCERFLVQSKKKTIIDVVNIALANLKFHAVHATSEYICNICVMVSSRREIICSRTWKNYRNIWEPESWSCFPAEKGLSRLLRSVTFVHLPFSQSLDLFVVTVLFMKGASCCVVRRNWSRQIVLWQIFKRSQVCRISDLPRCKNL